MNANVLIADLSRKIQLDPNDLDSKHTLGKLLIPIVLENWPQNKATLQTKEYKEFLHTIAIPLWNLLKGLESIEVVDFLFKIIGALHWLGEHTTAEAYVSLALEIKENLAKKHPRYNTGLRFFQTRTGIRTQFGHLIVEPECYVKSKTLGWVENIKPILLMPEGKCANPSLLRYWQKYFCVITNPKLCDRLSPLSATLEYNSFWLKVPNVGIRYGHSGVITTIRSWEKATKEPVLKLDPRHKKEGWEILYSMGVAKNSWFVVTHVRQSLINEIDSVSQRNSNIASYLPAYAEIIRRGGTVVRIGNPTMPRVESMQGFYDTAHNENLPDWFDLFLVAESKFFLGSASGPCSLAATFATPLVMSNIAANCFPVSEQDIFLPKLLREKSSGRLLTFKETLIPQLQYLFNGKIFDELGLETIDNEPEDLVNATIEMLQRIEGTVVYSEDDTYLLSRFDSLAGSLEGYPITCNLARDFAQKHRQLILN